MVTSSDQRLAAVGPFRARAARLAVQVSWLLWATTVIAGVRIGVFGQPRVWALLAASAIVLLALSLVDWTNAFAHPRGGALLTLWAILALFTIAVLSTVAELADVALLLYFALVVFSAVLASPIHHLVITLSAVASYAFVPLAFGGARRFTELLLPIMTLLIVALVTGRIAEEFRGEAEKRLSRSEELTRRQTAFERLYEVTKTMAAGSSLEGVLPELVGRIGRYLDAQVGLVVLHDPERAKLDVLSPIWTAGYALEIEGYSLSATGSGEIERVFQTGAPDLYHGIADRRDSHSILGELGVRSAMCVPLRVESRTIGVMVLADKEHGMFTQADLEALAALSAPAALVLAQLERIEAVADTSRRMEDLAKMKSDFVSVVSHELRTPITSIIGSLATLGRPELAPEKPQARELIASAQAQADRLRRLIEDLLMVSRIEHHALPQSPRRIQLDRFLNEVIGTIPSDGRAIRIEVRRGAQSVTADPDHLSRIVINLVDNALKYAPSSPVEVVADREDGRILIAVIDHGSGIELAERDRAFERFTQLEPAQTRSQGGAGLGLSIVRGLAQSMGGHLELSETPGGGATFVVSVPRVPGTYEGRDPAPLASNQ